MVKEIDKNLDADSEEDHVVVDGPSGLAGTLTPKLLSTRPTN